MTWYTWLEQGRPVRASAQVLQAIADALLLDPNERDYLFTLAEVALPSARPQDREIPPFLPALLRQLDPYPAAVQNAPGTCWPSTAPSTGCWGWQGCLRPSGERAHAVLLRTGPAPAVAGVGGSAPRLVSMFRTVIASARQRSVLRHQPPEQRLQRSSPLFDRLWQQHEVGVFGAAPEHFRHPEVGELSLIRFHLWAEPREDGLLAVGYTPADEATEIKLDRLLPLATAHAVS